jgi:hypothetical protein
MTTSRRADRSFVLGISSIVLIFFTGLPAIIFGLLGLRDIRRSGGQLQGKTLALAGIGFGLAGTSLGAALTLFVVDRIQDAAARIK